MPIDVSTFLANLVESRQATQVAERKGFVPASGLVLPVALEVALRHRFLLTPSLARSQLATTFVPSLDREQWLFWLHEHGQQLRWQLHLAESNIVALEVQPEAARGSLAALSEDDYSWQHSLHFRSHGRRHYLFGSIPGLPRLLHGYHGLRLIRGQMDVPPLYTPDGVEIGYEDDWAPLLPFPWIRASAFFR